MMMMMTLIAGGDDPEPPNDEAADDEFLEQHIVLYQNVLGAGALSQLFEATDATNAVEDKRFKEIVLCLFGKTNAFKRHSKDYMELVIKFQLHLLKSRHMELRASGATRKNIHAFV